MTKICKQIIHVLKSSPDHSLLYWDRDESMFPDQTEFFDAVRYLESKGLVEFIHNQDGVHLGIHATHKAMHPIGTGEHPFVHWLFHEYFGGIIVGATSALLGDFLVRLLLSNLPHILP
ncbi:MAG: hypothetical protein J6Y57_00970 [Lachnospiraceae bacterium]|nr:hypothetical protein [Lachnospiraceae bacterium]